MVRKLANKLLPLLFLLLPSAAFALGLGDIRLRSALNQPLDAEIELLSVKPGETDSIRAALASSETFSRIGLDRPAVLMLMRFQVEVRDGRPVVRLTSREPIREPFLSFLVELNWSSGRLLREYTVLLDPPTFEAEPPAIAAPKAAAPAAKVTAAPAATPAGGLSYGPVKGDDTLWSIATRMRPNQAISPQQMMMALLKANPDAFYDNNVNRLKKGYVLRIDDPSMITAMSHAEAVSELSRQNRAWQDHLKQAGSTAGERPVAAAVSAAPVAAVPEAPRLKLVAPAETETPAPKAAPGPLTATEQAAGAEQQLRKELLLAQEAAEAQKRENEELHQRMVELEQQLSSMQRLLTLKDSDLAALQQKSETAPQTAPEQVAPVKPAPAKPAAPKPAAPAEPSFMDELMSDPVALAVFGIVAVALLVLLAIIIRRRRSGGPGYSESILAAGAAPLTTSTTKGGAPSEQSSLFSDLAVSGMGGAGAGQSEVDPLTEADVYMAYGRYQQAEDLINEAIKNSPERHDLKVKLLEVFYGTKNREAFEKLAGEVFTVLEGAGPLWGKVLVMGHELCPDNPMFSATPQAGEGEGMAETTSTPLEDNVLDIGLDLDALAEDMEAAAEESGAFDLDLGVDFSDLEEPAGKKAETMATSGEKTAAEEALPEIELDMGTEAAAEVPAAPEMEEVLPELPAAPDEQAGETDEGLLDFDLGDFKFGGEEGTEAPEAATPAPESHDNALDFTPGEGVEATTAAPEATPATDELAGLEELGELDLGDLDAVGTKLDLARAYVDMGDGEAARGILDEVLKEGNDEQRQQAQQLLDQIS